MPRRLNLRLHSLFAGEEYTVVHGFRVGEVKEPPQLIRVLRPGGVLQLMFKNGQGVATVFDKDYGIDRSFQLFDEHEILGILQELGMALVEAESPDELGGFLYFTDPKPIDYCVFFARKDGA